MGGLQTIEGSEPDGDPLAWTRMHGFAWYILTVSPLCEKAVASRLRRRIDGVLTFAPITRLRVQRGHRRVNVERVAFPRYVFVGFPQDAMGEPPWLYVHRVMGVQGVFACDGAPYRIAADLVAGVIMRCATGFYEAARARSEWDERLADILARPEIYVDDGVSVSYPSKRSIG